MTQINPTCSLQGPSHGIHFLIFKKLSRDSVVTDSKGYNGFPQINILFNFSRINHRPLVIMNGCNKCCEINTGALDISTASSAPLKKWHYHRKNALQEMMSSYNRLLPIYGCLNQGIIIISIHDIYLLQSLFWKNTVNFK